MFKKLKNEIKLENKGYEMLTGGSINIDDGTFRVTDDGHVDISSGDINIGPVSINSRYTDLGGFRVTDGQYGAIVSIDRSQTIQIYSADNPDWDSGMIQVGDSRGNKTRISSKGVDVVDDIHITSMPREEGWSQSWQSVKKNIVELWKRVERLEDSI